MTAGPVVTRSMEEVTAVLKVAVDPEVTAVPKVTEKMENDLMAAPKVAVDPEVTTVPEVAGRLEEDLGQEVMAVPEVAAAPEVTAVREVIGSIEEDLGPEVIAILKAANAITEEMTGNTEALGQVVRPRGPGAEVPRIVVRPKKGHQSEIEAILYTTIKQVAPTFIEKAKALNIQV